MPLLPFPSLDVGISSDETDTIKKWLKSLVGANPTISYEEALSAFGGQFPDTDETLLANAAAEIGLKKVEQPTGITYISKPPPAPVAPTEVPPGPPVVPGLPAPQIEKPTPPPGIHEANYIPPTPEIPVTPPKPPPKPSGAIPGAPWGQSYADWRKEVGLPPETKPIPPEIAKIPYTKGAASDITDLTTAQDYAKYYGMAMPVSLEAFHAMAKAFIPPYELTEEQHNIIQARVGINEWNAEAAFWAGVPQDVINRAIQMGGVNVAVAGWNASMGGASSFWNTVEQVFAQPAIESPMAERLRIMGIGPSDLGLLFKQDYETRLQLGLIGEGGVRTPLSSSTGEIVEENGIEYRVMPDGTKIPLMPTDLKGLVNIGEKLIEPLPLLTGSTQDSEGNVVLESGEKFTPDGGFIDVDGTKYSPEQVAKEKELWTDIVKLFPDQDIQELMRWADTFPTRFTMEFWKMGDSPLVRATMEEMGMTDEYIDLVFSGEFLKKVPLTPQKEAKQAEPVQQINPDTGEVTSMRPSIGQIFSEELNLRGQRPNYFTRGLHWLTAGHNPMAEGGPWSSMAYGPNTPMWEVVLGLTGMLGVGEIPAATKPLMDIAPRWLNNVFDLIVPTEGSRAYGIGDIINAITNAINKGKVTIVDATKGMAEVAIRSGANPEDVANALKQVPGVAPEAEKIVTDTIENVKNPPQITKPRARIVKPNEPLEPGMVKQPDGTFVKTEDVTFKPIKIGDPIPEVGSPQRYDDPITGKTYVAVQPKEPWQMTREEYRAEYIRSDYPYQDIPSHRKEVRLAIAEGKPVPPEVLAEYPDLAKLAPKVAPKGITPEWGKGGKAKIISRYGDVPVGREGTIVKSWVVESGEMKGQTYVTLDFGVNQTGQRLRNTYPANVLEEVAPKMPEVAPKVGEAAQRAKGIIGITNNPKEAGYVLPNGEMLDFTGRHYASGYEKGKPKVGEPDYLAGERSVDHREISIIYGEGIGGNEAMVRFESEGNIRVAALEGDLNVSLQLDQVITPKQIETLNKMYKSTGGSVNYDIYKVGGEGSPLLSKEANSINQVIADFKAKGGKVSEFEVAPKVATTGELALEKLDEGRRVTARAVAGKMLKEGKTPEQVIKTLTEGGNIPEDAAKTLVDEVQKGWGEVGYAERRLKPSGIVPPEKPPAPSRMPVGEGKARESEHFRKMNEAIDGALGDNLLYKTVNRADQTEKALALNAEDLRKVSLGLKKPPEDLLDLSASTVYEKTLLNADNIDELTRAVNSSSLRATAEGQNLSMLRGAVSDNSPIRFMKQVIGDRVNQVGSKLPEVAGKTSTPATRLTRAINKEVDQLTKAINAKKVDIVEAQKIIDSLGVTAGDELKLAFKNGDLAIDELYGMTSEARRTAFEQFSNAETARAMNTKFERAMVSKQKDALQNWVKTISSSKKQKTLLDRINELDKVGALDTESSHGFLSDLVATKLGADVTPEEVAKIKLLSEGLEGLSTKFVPGLGEVQDLPYWKARQQLENYIQSLTPTHPLKVVTSLIGRGMMLMSFKSPIVNITSNTVHGTVQMLERRIASRAWTGMNNEFWRAYVLKDMEIYNKTGYGISRMDKLWTGQRRLGEQIIHAQGPGGVRKVGRFFEDVVFDKMMGAPDEYAASFAFADSANPEITRIVRQEGLTGEAAVTKHLELSKKVVNVNSTGDELVDMIRAKAISDARVATWTNEGNYSRFALAIRSGFNKIPGNLMLGDQLMPFVKTPANIVEISVDSAGLGVFKGIYKGVKGIKTGDTKLIQEAVRDVTRGGTGIALATALAYSLNPDDFIPPYEACTSKEREMAQLKNAPYNSVLLGGKYISLDYFGALGAPFVGIMMARKATEQGKGIPEAIGQYGRGAVQQVTRVPGVQEVGEIATGISKAFAQPDIEKTAIGMANTIGQFIKSRGIPAILGDIAAGIDPFQRQIGTSALAQAKAAIPGLRETLPPKVERVTGEVMPTEGFISTLLFGSRVKTARDNAVIGEIDRLYGVDAAPTIANIENSSKLAQKLKAEIGEDSFVDALVFYGQTYGDKASKEINSPEYQELSDEDKMKRLNSLRSDAVDEMIRKYQKSEILPPLTTRQIIERGEEGAAGTAEKRLGESVYTQEDYNQEDANLKKKIGKKGYTQRDYDRETKGLKEHIGEPYSTNNLASLIEQYGYTPGRGDSPIEKFYFEADDKWQDYLDASADEKDDMRKEDAQLDAYLVFWGKSSTFMNHDAEPIVRELMAKYNIPEKAIPAFAELYVPKKAQKAGITQEIWGGWKAIGRQKKRDDQIVYDEWQYLLKHPELDSYLHTETGRQEAKLVFHNIPPSDKFLKAWDKYDSIRKSDGSTDTKARTNFRIQNCWFDAEGVKSGYFDKPRPECVVQKVPAPIKLK